MPTALFENLFQKSEVGTAFANNPFGLRLFYRTSFHVRSDA